MRAWEEEAATAAGGEGGAVLAERGRGSPTGRGARGGNRRVAGSGLPGGGRGLEPSGDPAANLRFLGVTGSEGTATDCLGGRGAERPPFPLVADSFAPCNEQPFFVLSQRRQRLGLGLLASRLHTTLASRHRVHWKRRVNRDYTRQKKKKTYRRNVGGSSRALGRRVRKGESRRGSLRKKFRGVGDSYHRKLEACRPKTNGDALQLERRGWQAIQDLSSYGKVLEIGSSPIDVGLPCNLIQEGIKMKLGRRKEAAQATSDI